MKNLLVVILMVLGIINTACGTQVKVLSLPESKNTASVQTGSTKELGNMEIKPQEAKARLDKGESVILLDVRTEEEYNEKRIPGSILIPVEGIDSDAPAKLTDKAAVIFVYCRSGRRSAIAVEVLTLMGYTKVYDLGGIEDWPYETVSGK